MAVLALKGRAGRAGRGGMAGRAVMAVMAAGLVAGSLQAQQAAPPAVRPSERVAAGGNLPPGDSLRNPFAGDSAAIAQGAKLRFADGLNVKTASQTSAILNFGMGYRMSPKNTVNMSVGIGLTADSPNFSVGLNMPLAF